MRYSLGLRQGPGAWPDPSNLGTRLTPSPRALSHHAWLRVVAWFLGRLERYPGEHSASLTTSPSRQHDREEELQAAADKVGRLLFQVHLRLRVTGRPEDAEAAKRKLDEITGA